MFRPEIVVAIARAEARLTRRLVRYWIFTILSALLAILSYAYYAVIHWSFSSWSATVGSINPRFLVGGIGFYYLFFYLIGLVFLGYDVRARDKRERIVEVLDARPCTNLELMFGKYLGLLLPSWIPMLLTTLLLGITSRVIGEPIEARSLFGLAVVMGVPAFTFLIGLVFLVSLLVRHRGAAAVVLILALAGIYFAIFMLPIYLTPAVDVTGAYVVQFPSDIVPGVADLDGYAQRLGVLLAGLAMVWLAAAVHPRLDQRSRKAGVGLGLAILVVGLAMGVGVALKTKRLLGLKQQARALHETHRSDPAPDVLSILGTVRILPGSRLEQDLNLRFRAPEEARLSTALFSLNPGLAVERMSDAGGRALSFTHERGLLSVRLAEPLEPGQEASIALEARGKPASWFSYLDGVIEPMEVNVINGQIFLLGFEPLIFDRRYVALMPGARWLPASGDEIGRNDPKVRPPDFYDIDLRVEVPEGWAVAGPGRAQAVAGAGGGAGYRFAPPAPVTDVALVAGRFESRSTEIDGVRLEVLVHPAHARNLEFFEEAAGEIHKWLADRLQEARALGLGYPYDGLTLVEVPTTLRGYAGGWRHDTTMAQPALVLMRESSFPTAHFGGFLWKPDELRDREGGLPRAKREMLERLFENDFNGGNPFAGASRSFFTTVTAGKGNEALPLDFLCETLATRLVTDKQGYFSAHIFNNEGFNQTISDVIGNFFGGQAEGGSVADAMIRTVTSRVEVWDAILGVSLVELDPWKEPERTVDVLTLKGGAMARSMLDGLGRDRAGRFLAALRRRAQGRPFTREDVLAAGSEVGEDLESWLEVWLERTELPGFLVGQARIERLPDGEGGSPRYQLLLPVRNDEPAPGLLKLDYRTGDGGPAAPRGASEPVRVEGRTAIELGLVTAEPPRMLRVVPYLALNREPFTVPVPAPDVDRIVQREPFVGAREVSWAPPNGGSIVIDDLDAGFSVKESERRGLLRFGARGGDEALDQGLPIHTVGRPPSRWSRQSQGGAWGKYRHTLALVRPGGGERRAVFAAHVPRQGSWRLEYHVPRLAWAPGEGAAQDRRKRLGFWALEVVDSGGRHPVKFDAGGGEDGWNAVGTFDLPAGDVRVELSDETDGRLVIADAIRWTPAVETASARAER